MGWGKDGGGGGSTVNYTPQQSSPDYESILGTQMAMTEQILSTQSANTQMMLESMSNNQMPTASDYTPDVDYKSENQKLQERIEAGIAEEDMHRKGVLGTIKTNLDDDDEPDTVTSSLLLGS